MSDETTPIAPARFETLTPAESLTTTSRTSATADVPPRTGFATVAEIVAAAPKNVTFSVARITPAADPIVIVATPDVPSGNTWTTWPFCTVIARPVALGPLIVVPRHSTDQP